MRQSRITLCTLIISLLLVGCSLFRHEIILQEKSGPHGGVLMFIDEYPSKYIEFVSLPGDEWIFQVFKYNKSLEPRTIKGRGRLEIELPDGIRKEIGLRNTKRYVWSRGVGHLENKIKLGNVDKFSVKLILSKGKTRHKEYLNYIYSDHILSAEEAKKDLQK